MKLIILAAVVLISFIVSRIKETAKRRKMVNRLRRTRVADDVWPYERAEKSAPAMPPVPAAAVPAAAPMTVGADEGARVTADTPPMAPPSRPARRPVAMPRGGLREAFIWSEIFRRRF